MKTQRKPRKRFKDLTPDEKAIQFEKDVYKLAKKHNLSINLFWAFVTLIKKRVNPTS